MAKEGGGGGGGDGRAGANRGTRYASAELMSRLPTPRSAYRELGEVALMDAMRRCDERAIDEFIVRYQRLLHERVRQWRITLDDASDAISDVVEEVAVLIINGRLHPKRSLAGYVVKSLRTRIAQQSKTDDTRSEAEERAAIDGAGEGERVVSSVVSEGTLRASHGPDWTSPTVSLTVSRLVSMIDEELSEEERRILVWLGNYVPQRDICEWLGVSYPTGTQRIWRLRERLRAAVLQYAHHFDFKERSELFHFFRRIRAIDATSTSSPTQRKSEGGGTP